MGFTYTARHSEQQIIVTVTGDIDLPAYPSLQAEIANWVGKDADVILECSEVTFMDSMGLRFLVQARHAILQGGHSLILADPSRPVMRVLELGGVVSLFGYGGRQVH